MHSRQCLCKNHLRLLSPVTVALCWINLKPLTFPFYMILSDILNISVPSLIFFLFLFKLLQDLLAKFECKYSNWAVTVSGLISMSYKIGCCQSSEDHGYRLYLIGSSREIVYLQISCVFGVSVILFVINYSVCWKITSVLAFSLGAWDSGLLNSNENCF